MRVSLLTKHVIVQLVFAHCDLLSANIIIHREPGQELSVSFIDYEYATPSPAAFDIGNHFAEFAATLRMDEDLRQGWAAWDKDGSDGGTDFTENGRREGRSSCLQAPSYTNLDGVPKRAVGWADT